MQNRRRSHERRRFLHPEASGPDFTGLKPNAGPTDPTRGCSDTCIEVYASGRQYCVAAICFYAAGKCTVSSPHPLFPPHNRSSFRPPCPVGVLLRPIRGSPIPRAYGSTTCPCRQSFLPPAVLQHRACPDGVPRLRPCVRPIFTFAYGGKTIFRLSQNISTDISKNHLTK